MWEVWSVSMHLCGAGGVFVEFKVQVESSVVVYFVVYVKTVYTVSHFSEYTIGKLCVCDILINCLY